MVHGPGDEQMATCPALPTPPPDNKVRGFSEQIIKGENDVECKTSIRAQG